MHYVHYIKILAEILSFVANPTCPHSVVISLPKNQDPKLSAFRMCMAPTCGATFILTPLDLKDNPKCAEIIAATVKEIKENLPKYGA